MKYVCNRCGQPLTFDLKKKWYVHPQGMKHMAICKICKWIGEAREDRCPACEAVGTLTTHHCADRDISKGIKE